ncbi:hypothetical protein [Arthrobacter sp. 31Y]|uniref:hypothetical protein n=1 Tax=Arthrobacter sp. 31Y TaxID=1115632 RepID=UPI000467E4E4|nr:hypothetical protein [Arthrobacter sp. 31Y]
MTVVILDTNALPHGHYNERVLNDLIEVASRGAKIVIPEVVVWEWAEHARLAQESLAEVMKHHRVDETLVARPPLPEIPDIEELVTRIESVLRGRATIWSPPAGVWRDALMQQVLQIGAGERKAGTKTGAADAVVLACVEDQVYTAEGAAVLLTKDDRLRAACKARCEDALVANGVGQLLPQLNAFEPAEEDLVVRAMEDLPLFLNEEIADRGQAMAFDDLGVEFQSGTARLAGDTSPRMSAILLSHVDIAEIHAFSIARDDTNRYGLAELRIFGDISMVIVEQLQIAPVQYAPAPEVVPLSMAHIDVTVAIRWNHNWQLEGIEPTGVAVVSIPDEDELDDEDVPEFRATALGFPGRTGRSAKLSSSGG